MSTIIVCRDGPDSRESAPILGFEDRYSITNCGHVWSHRSQVFLKPRINKGYHMVGLKNGSIGKTVSIHRLVALAFVPNPENLPVVNHKDLDKSNNHYTNLEWCTQHYNIWHYELTRSNRNWVGREEGLTSEEAGRIEALYKTGLIDIRRLAKAFGISKSTVGRIVNGDGYATV